MFGSAESVVLLDSWTVVAQFDSLLAATAWRSLILVPYGMCRKYVSIASVKYVLARVSR